ncbi:hypothetical protein GOB86_05115 [Acetobacter lambici]|uniref:Uncharacterized protein n=1 Tax=Acetobacter lambici TaxID=1332824 RepID=A0ABT1EWS9_9PROT|nr:hypothetical protein [Acetobacter lambici]MCP1241977.1 hypothetical protein [Acetobacter lambici]MCP1257405.1 hypothetical protein [Acetobacter lambici]NHO56453.1 hypothetical protein [Acetobacter lambici]
MTHSIPWGWVLLFLPLMVVQALAMVLAAPWLSGLVGRVAGRLSGVSSFPVMGRWQDIWHQFRRPRLGQNGMQLAGIACAGALVLAVLGCGLTPAFTLVIPDLPAPGLLLICCVLVMALVLLNVPCVLDGGLGAVRGARGMLGAFLLLPALVPVFLLCGARDFSDFLARVHGLSPVTDGAPFVLAGVALFLVPALAWPVQDEKVALLAGPERAMWLWAADCVQIAWVVLALDTAWPGSLALPDDGGMEQWLSQYLLGFGLWGVKLMFAGVLLALVRLVVLPPLRRARVRLVSIFLLGVLALQVTWSVHPRLPERDDTNVAATVQEGGPQASTTGMEEVQ